MGSLSWNDSSCKTQKRFDFESTIWTTKIVLISVGVVASLVLFRITIIPYASIFLISTLPCFWDSLKVLFSPPYIYIIVNFIILIIAASSTLQDPNQNHPAKDGKKTSTTTTTNDLHHRAADANPADDTQFDPISVYQDKTHDHVYHVEENNGNQLGEVWQEKDEAEKSVVATPVEKDREVLKPLKEETSVSLDTFRTFPRKNESNEVENKQIVEERAELDLLGNSNVSEEPDDTLDSIWRAIMEGQGKPHLTKCDTWNGWPKLARAEPETAVDDARRELRKSETFNENNNNSTVLSTPRRERVVMSQDELNQRAEAFINKFTNDMRLEREQSNQRHLEMINRGLH